MKHEDSEPGTLRGVAAMTTPPSGGALAQAGIGLRTHEGPALRLAERTGVTLARLQTLLTASERSAAFDGCGLPLPHRVNDCAGRDPAVLCLAPGDWLLFSEFLDFRRLSEPLGPHVDAGHALLLDQSSSLAVFRLGGAAAPWLLQKLCGLDIFGAVAGGRHCAQTRLEHAAVILHYHEPGSGGIPRVFDLLADRSLARYVWQLLLTSAPHAEELHSRYGNPA